MEIQHFSEGKVSRLDAVRFLFFFNQVTSVSSDICVTDEAFKFRLFEQNRLMAAERIIRGHNHIINQLFSHNHNYSNGCSCPRQVPTTSCRRFTRT